MYVKEWKCSDTKPSDKGKLSTKVAPTPISFLSAAVSGNPTGLFLRTCGALLFSWMEKNEEWSSLYEKIQASQSR